MAKSFCLRGIEQIARGSKGDSADIPATNSVSITPLRHLAPGSARDAGVIDVEAAADEVVRVVLENGFVLWSRADDLIRERGKKSPTRGGSGEAWEIDVRPPQRDSRGSARGWLGIGIKVLQFFGVDLKGRAARELGEALEMKLLRGNAPGLYRCSLDDAFSLNPENSKVLPTKAQPILLFIHGTASCCQGSFGKLWETKAEAQMAARSKMREMYGDRVYAWEHRTLTQSPIQNAVELAKMLPANTPIHVVTHSRGGLVGELLCLAQRDITSDPLKDTMLDMLFAADDTVAEQLGLAPLEEQEKSERDKGYEADRARLKELLGVLDGKKFTINRFVRVACPARGTTLASGRLDRWLSVLDFVSGNGLFGDVADFLLAVVKERADPRTLPGIEAMMPGSALTRLLHMPELQTTSDLSVISGDVEGENLWGQIKLFAADWFYGADHDLVVNTGSMYGGIRRKEGNARFLFDKGDKVCHFNYFYNPKSVRWLVEGLARSEGAEGSFKPIQEAKHEAPKWREAVRRSRERTAPQPLAMVLPGIMGSSLHVGGEEVWLNYRRLLLGGLRHLNREATGVEPTNILDDFYGPLLEFLTRTHRVEIFPYDWRLSVRHAAAKLAEKLEVLLPEAERTGQPVHLVAHSMGGLVVRAMLADSGRGAAVWRRITALPNSRFLMLGTPNRGSYEAMRWLTGCNPTELKLSLLDFTQTTNNIIDIVRRYPGLLELLPFADDDPDFTQQSRWKEIKKELDAPWKLAEVETLRDVARTWTLIKTSTTDPERMVYVAGHHWATVCDYQLYEDDEDRFRHARKKLCFLATKEGDGTVTWKSGSLKGVKTWYVEDTAHDALCTQKRAFPGYLDLLMKGSTTLLKDTPPGLGREAGPSDHFVLPQLPFTDDIPDERSMRGFGFGSGWPVAGAVGEAVLPVIRVSITHGNLAYANHHVLVGHYQGDTIVSAEAELDKRLDMALSHRMQLGIYPGPLKTHAVFSNQKPGANPRGALVVGLGQVGELSPGLLEVSIRNAMLDYVMHKLQYSAKDREGKEGVCAVKLTSMLVGSGAGGMTVRDSIEAILHAAVAANKKLLTTGLENRVLIDKIEFLELFEDVAIAAAEALETALKDGELATVVDWQDRVVRRGQGGRRRARCDDLQGWWQRLEIIEEKGREGLRFIATTDRARAEETQANGQLKLADNFIRLASQSPQVNEDAAKTLFEMLLPNRLKELAPKQTDLVLLLDEVSASYPWELLEDRWNDGNKPPAVAAGMVRQLKSRQFRPVPAPAYADKVFVVGNPNLDGWPGFPPLPGARQEAHCVAELLAARGFTVLESVDEKADSILSGLHSDAWRILHFAGHGEHEYPLTQERKNEEVCTVCEQKPPETKKTMSGMAIGYNTFLTPGDVEQMRWVPELVFINCCHLGKTVTEKPRNYNRLAANLAVQFIRMGVKAVVASGWAVDDRAALAFAESFYGHLLCGETFGEAVRAARAEIWVQYPNVNTWGAYQCYGDPSFRLRSNGQKPLPGKQRSFHATIELVTELQNLRESIRMDSREVGAIAEAVELNRQAIAGLTERIPEKLQESWLKRGEVAAAYGFVWGELGDYAMAVEYLEQSLKAEQGDVPVSAVEQYADFQVRLASAEWQHFRASAVPRTRKAASEQAQKRQAIISRIERAFTAISFLCERAPTKERLNLLGSACKRMAQIHDDEATRHEALVNMGNYYRRAYELRKEAEDVYPFSNWAQARALAGRDLGLVRDECQRMMDIARKRDEEDPSYWNSVARADLEMTILLAQPGITADAASGAAETIIEGYRNAFKSGASPREMASVRENLDFVIAMNEGAAKPLRDALVTIRAAV